MLHERLQTLHQLYLAGGIAGPEHHEVNPGLPDDSRENFLYFTMAVSINFQRNSAALWKSALAAYRDPTTRYIFDPAQVVATDIDVLRRDLLKHKVALQPNKHIEIWRRIAATFHEHYHGDPRAFLARYDWNVPEIIAALQIKEKARFPYLSGLKMSNYWLFILSSHTSAPFKNLHEISIIPDTHVIQSSVHLGIVPAGAQPAQVEAAWRPILQSTGLSPTEMHSALWRWSRNHFHPDI